MGAIDASDDKNDTIYDERSLCSLKRNIILTICPVTVVSFIPDAACQQRSSRLIVAAGFGGPEYCTFVHERFADMRKPLFIL